MKNKLKIICSCLPLIAPACLTTIATSCSKPYTKYNKIAETIKSTTIEEFIKLSKCYRPTYHTQEIADYLVAWATEHNFKPHNDKATYKPDKTYLDSGYNLYFDVPSSTGGENIPPIILQGHTDMVAVGTIVKGTGVIVEQVGKYLQSKDNMSSLGADNGIGVATMLSFAIHKDEFVHGPIRMIFTTDEEDGNSGISQIPDEWLVMNDQNIKDIVNCDSEDYEQMSVACGGASQVQFKPTLTKSDTPSEDPEEKKLQIVSYPKQWNTCKIQIKNLLGGHSALVIDQGRINAIKLMCKLIETINLNTPEPVGSEPVYPRIVSACERASIDDDVNIGTIPSSMTIVIATPLKQNDLIKCIDEVQNRALIDYPNETKATITYEFIDTPETPYAMSSEGSESLIKTITSIPYGVIKYSQQFGIDLSSNVAGFRVVTDQTNNYFEVDAMARSYIPEQLIKVVAGYDTVLGNNFKDKIFEKTGYNHPWISEDGDPFQSLLIDGAHKANINLKSTRQSWWLEPGAFLQKALKLGYTPHMASVGVTVYDAHAVTEKIDTDTIAPFIKMLLYALENLK